jgi:hypothetical protein
LGLPTRHPPRKSLIIYPFVSARARVGVIGRACFDLKAWEDSDDQKPLRTSYKFSPHSVQLK